MTAYSQIARNKRRTIVLMMVFIAFVLAIGYFSGEYYGGDGLGGLVLASIIALGMTSTSYFAGDKVALASAGAREITREDNMYIWNLVENLTITAGMPMPKVYIINDPMMNAFATGRKPELASIALTTGIINALEKDELEGVIAHELSHIQNYDTRLMMVVIVLVGVIALLSDWAFRMSFFGDRRSNNNNSKGGGIQLAIMVVGVVLVILSPLIAELIKLAISRKREYMADATGVLLTRYPDALARALQKISNTNTQDMQRASHATAHLYLVSPFAAAKWSKRLFSTHPPIEERIAALEQMG